MSETLEPIIVFIDLETTGLDPNIDAITEIAWIYEKPQSPTERSVCKKPVERHRYVTYQGFPSRWAALNTKALDKTVTRIDPKIALGEFFEELTSLCENGTRDIYLAGALPSFDDSFLRKQFRQVPYHYHLIDVESMAFGALGLRVPVSLAELRSKLGIEGTFENQHCALADVREAKLIYDAALAHQTQSLFG